MWQGCVGGQTDRAQGSVRTYAGPALGHVALPTCNGVVGMSSLPQQLVPSSNPRAIVFTRAIMRVRMR